MGLSTEPINDITLCIESQLSCKLQNISHLFSFIAIFQNCCKNPFFENAISMSSVKLLKNNWVLCSCKNKMYSKKRFLNKLWSLETSELIMVFGDQCHAYQVISII